MTPEERIAKEKELANYDGPDKVVSSIELAEKFKAMNLQTKRFQTGIPALDLAIEGMEPGEVVTISGETGNGKTFLADTIVRNLRDKSIFSIFFTYEVTASKFVQWHNHKDSVVFLPQEHRPQELEWIRQRIWEAKIKYSCEVAVIDHLHYVIPLDSHENMSLVIGKAMRFIKKEIALDLGVTVILLCHTEKIKDGQEPSLFHIRDSSLIPQESDTVLMVWRRNDVDLSGNKLETVNNGLATIKVEKARRTGVMHEKIKMKRDGMRLIESIGEPEANHAKPKRNSVDDSMRYRPQKTWEY